MTAESFKISYRYVNDSGEIETEIKPIGLAPSQKQAKVSLSLPGNSKPEIDIDVMVDPMNPVGYLPELSERELKRRLPEIQYIENNALREQVIELLLAECPEHYWTYPASTSGNHHPMDERTRHGQWNYTKRMFSAFKYISESSRETANTNNIPGKFGISKHERMPPRGLPDTRYFQIWKIRENITYWKTTTLTPQNIYPTTTNSQRHSYSA
jgi:hypothetical protein